MMINPIYQGKESVAITQYHDAYAAVSDTNLQSLKRNLEFNTRFFGVGYKTLVIFNGVGSTCKKPIDNAIKQLNSKQQIDLEHILE